MNKQVSIGLIILAVLALTFAIGALIEAGQVGDVQTMALTGTGQTDLTTLALSEDLTVGDDATITDDASVGGDLSVTGSASFGSTTFSGGTINGALTIDGSADAVQLTVQGYTTQTTAPNLFVVENSSASDLFWVTATGDAELNGTTPTFTLGDAGEENAGIVIDGAAQDFYIALQDTVDDLIIGLGNAIGTTGIIYLDENQDVGLGGASAGAKLDVTGNVLVDGGADEEQLVVQGHSTQNWNPFTVAQSDGTRVFGVSNAGNTLITGTLGIRGAVSDLNGPLGINDNALVTGTLGLTGAISDGGGPLGLDDDVLVTGTLGIQSTLNDTNGPLGIDDNARITGTLSIYDAIDDINGPLGLNDNVLVTGTLGLTGAISDGGGPLGLDDNVLITGTVSTNSTGYFASTLQGSTVVSLTTASDTLVATDKGGLYYNLGAGNGVTITLPAASAGLHFCFYDTDAVTLYVDPIAGDQIHSLTNATADAVVANAAGASLCLVAVDDTYWLPVVVVGTWSDAES